MFSFPICVFDVKDALFGSQKIFDHIRTQAMIHKCRSCIRGNIQTQAEAG